MGFHFRDGMFNKSDARASSNGGFSTRNSSRTPVILVRFGSAGQTAQIIQFSKMLLGWTS